MVPVTFAGVRLDALDAERLAAYWAQLLGWGLERQPGGVVTVVPDSPACYPIVVSQADTLKRGQSRIHFDVTTSSHEEMLETVERACALGAGPADVGQSPDEPHVVLADPEGNELCVIPPDNRFLADTGRVGAINCDGSQAVGYFWSRALGWPLVWDQDEETAIQAPSGGSKITWSGPPLMPRRGRDRFRFILTTNDWYAAIAHLRSLGASLAEAPPSEWAGEATLLDPDGNELHLVADAVAGGAPG